MDFTPTAGRLPTEESVTLRTCRAPAPSRDDEQGAVVQVSVDVMRCYARRLLDPAPDDVGAHGPAIDDADDRHNWVL